jgi:hypothetical protein
MASILRVNTLTDASSNNSVPMATVSSGSSKSWMNLNGEGTIATRDSFNVSTIVDRGTGLYTQRFTSNMLNDDYAGSGSSQATYQDVIGRNRMMVGDAISTSDIYVNTFTTSGGAIDVGMVASTVHGDLA